MVSSTLVWAALAVGAGCGAVLRFLLDGAVSRALPRTLPVGTLAVNLSGALVLGIIDGAALPHDVAFVFGTGVVGSYTTFSTWMFETQRLAEERQSWHAWLNVVLPVLLGIAVAGVGLWIGRHL